MGSSYFTLRMLTNFHFHMVSVDVSEVEKRFQGFYILVRVRSKNKDVFRLKS